MKTMNCRDAQAQLLGFVENELDSIRRAALQDHLGGCPACRRELQEIENLRGALASEPGSDPGTAFWERFPDQVWRKYQSEVAGERHRGFGARVREMFEHARPAPASGLWVSTAAVLVMVVGVALFLTLQAPGTSGIAALQARIQGGNDLARLARRAALDLPADTRYGFSAAPDNTNFFLVGHRYAEALAYAAGGDAETARQRLAAVGASLGSAPENLVALVQNKPSLQQVTALEDELARIAAAAGTPQSALFRTGGMLANLALGVAARDQAAVREAVAEILRLRGGLDSAGVAPGALRDLNALAELPIDRDLSDRDYASAARLIRNIQLTLM